LFYLATILMSARLLLVGVFAVIDACAGPTPSLAGFNPA